MIRYEQFSKHFGTVEAANEVSLHVLPSEVVALVGPNGSGKSTTLKAAIGLVRPTAGRVLVNGADAARDPEVRRRLGYLPQRLSFPQGVTAREAMRYYSRLRGASETEIAPLLNRVGLDTAADRHTDGYSSGMRQRLGLAIALLGRPRALVLDEPSAALDPTGALLVRDLIAEIHAEGTTVLLSSHDLAEVEALADRVAVFVDGRIRGLGTVEELASTTSVSGLEGIYRRLTEHPSAAGAVLRVA